MNKTGLNQNILKKALLHGLLLGLPMLLGGCTFLAFPVVPDPVKVSLPILPKTEGLKLQDKTLQLKVGVPGGVGYLGVVWYQEDHELSRESVYIDEKLPEVTFKQAIDPALPHRAILLYDKKIIRQYEYEPPKTEGPKTEPPKTEGPKTETPPAEPPKEGTPDVPSP